MNAPNFVKSILIVESHNDASFINLLLHELGIDAELSVVVEHLHKFLDDSGEERRGKEAIGEKLKTVRRELEKKFPDAEKLGIILDFDTEPHWNFDKNIGLVNDAVTAAFGLQTPFSKESELITVDTVLAKEGNTRQLQASCFFTKDSSGEGNLDTLLIEIRVDQDVLVPYADCLMYWRDCVNKPESNSKLKVSDGTYRKIWIDNLLRAKVKELLNSKASKEILSDFQDRKKEAISQVGAAVFDLNHPSLADMRAFLEMFR